MLRKKEDEASRDNRIKLDVFSGILKKHMFNDFNAIHIN